MIKIMPLIFILVTFGCVSPTAYQPADWTGGYSETPLSPTKYKVMFSGNGVTEGRFVRDAVLYRSAELARAKGYRYFQILDFGSGASTGTVDGGVGVTNTNITPSGYGADHATSTPIQPSSITIHYRNAYMVV
jgi:hypothetical protein